MEPIVTGRLDNQVQGWQTQKPKDHCSNYRGRWEQ